ncbi:adhesion G-protein coupled receptor G5 [Pimephales promelas]|uniref:adhesion G-protein coupled receptor G5 n=1 Tax=Pimephales promelas TaxID=90988 RepID=UPI0019559A9E|nr:adhesion G-protein coupled receptor G5 [Pimephales promelas]
MFLRILEILSGMKWNIWGLLLISPGLFCISAKQTKAVETACGKNPNKPVCAGVNAIKWSNSGNGKNLDGIVILGTDGLMGFMEKGYSSTCNDSRFSAGMKHKMTVFSFQENTTSPSTSSSDFGLSLFKDSKHSTYILNISRSITLDQCIIEGACRNGTWTNWIPEGLNWTLPKNFTDTNCRMTCLNPTNTCEIAKYDSSCRDDNAGDESKMNTIKISSGSANCIKCGSPFQKVEEIKDVAISNIFNNTHKGETDAAKAVEAMNYLPNLLALMENMTTASISLGEVKGVLKKIQNVSDIKKSAFIYSAETGIRVIDDFSVLKDYPNALTIPEEATKQAFNKSAGYAFLGVFRFPNMSKDENNSTVLGNQVFAIEMGTRISNLTENISLAFSNKENMIGTPACNSWDGSGNKPNWTTEGCTTVPNGKDITCNCNHLTFFAVLMVHPVPIPEADLVALTYITYIGCGLSMFFLGVGFFIHFLLRKAKATNSAHVLMNLFLALFLLNLAFLSNEYIARAKSPGACRVIAGFMHFSLLASFSWFAVEALHLCLQMARHSIVIKHYILKLSVAGWVPPAFIVSIIFIFGKYGEQTIQTDTSNVTMCWILDSTVHYAVNIGFYCFVFIFTCCTSIVVLRWLSMLKVRKFNKAAAVKRSGTASFDITTILGLCCLLGLTWSFTFFSFGSLALPSYYIFTILNSFQGFFLFIYYMKTSSLFGDSVPSEDMTSDMTEETQTENPYDNEIPTPNKKAV